MTAATRRVRYDHPDAAALRDAYFAELDVRLGGFVPPPADALRADGEHGVTLVRYDASGAPVACGSLREIDAETVELKRVFVAPAARGKGHARAMVRALEDEARARGVRRVILDTAGPLPEAHALYEAEGYVDVERYNDNPYAARWFEKRLS